MGKYLKKLEGNVAEKKGCRYLKSLGYKILARNFHSRSGEIDLIAYDREHKEIVFVEVRYRREGFDSALESINRIKELRIIRTAEYWLMLNKKYSDWFTRFDVLLLTRDQANKWQVRHIADAFRV
jgi:putative endonuclease